MTPATQNLVLSPKLVRTFALVRIAVMAATAVAIGGPVRVEQVEYRGGKRNVQLSNGDVMLIATLEVGPRIICDRLKGGRNVFKEYEDQLRPLGRTRGDLGAASGRPRAHRGGHRTKAAIHATVGAIAVLWSNSPWEAP